MVNFGQKTFKFNDYINILINNTAKFKTNIWKAKIQGITLITSDFNIIMNQENAPLKFQIYKVHQIHVSMRCIKRNEQHFF